MNKKTKLTGNELEGLYQFTYKGYDVFFDPSTECTAPNPKWIIKKGNEFSILFPPLTEEDIRKIIDNEG